MNETAATGGVMYANEGPYTIDVRHVEEMVEQLEKRWMATKNDGDETGDENGGPGDESGDKTAATAGDERDGDGSALRAAFSCGI